MFRLRLKNAVPSLRTAATVAVLMLWIAPGALLADKIILKNGVILEGRVYDQTPLIIRMRLDQGGTVTVQKKNAVGVVYGSNPIERFLPEKTETKTKKPVQGLQRQKEKVLRQNQNIPDEQPKTDPEIPDEKPETLEKQETEIPGPEPEAEPKAEAEAEPEPEIEPLRRNTKGPLADPLTAPFIANLANMPPGVSREELSRKQSLLLGENNEQELILRARPQSERIDLDHIVVMPLEPDKQGRLPVHTTAENKPVALVQVDYSRSGLNVPEAIRQGRILEHEVLLRNHKGTIIGRAPLNFISFRFERVTEQRQERRFLILPGATSVTVGENKDRQPKTRIVANIQNYTDRDFIPQSIELKSRPDPGYPVSLQVRILLINPYLANICKECIENSLYKKAKQDYESAMQKLRKLEANPGLIQDDSAEKEPEEIAQLAHKKADAYRKDVKEAIRRMNQASHTIREEGPDNHTSGGNFIQYREMHLYSKPYFFEIADAPGASGF